jgi:redox-sensitive bicupin YhaK (pirin superfamily)
MLQHYKHEDLGHVQFDWLDTHHHFSFGHHHNPKRVHFGTLRVINDDIIQAGTGFDTHPHDNMEIITYVRKGAIIHRDSAGNEGKTVAGDVQVMSAGTGIAHSEHADSDEDTELFQIWIFPREKGVTPRWEQAVFSKEPMKDDLNLLVSGFAEDKEALYIHQDAAIYGGRMERGLELSHSPRTDKVYALMAEGSIAVNGQTLNKGDGAEITDEKIITLKAEADSEILLIEV